VPVRELQDVITCFTGELAYFFLDVAVPDFGGFFIFITDMLLLSWFLCIFLNDIRLLYINM
ncbi:hypothetical protein LXA57_17560, partial [Erwinia amylovora]|uniref:hypothetical protein n=1 Tax=Erwinia amylovora TaxID=552 RepID=UPI0020C1633F